MKLTEKCKEEFEKWYKDNYREYECYNCMDWDEFIPSMQIGVYIDYFDSVGVYINIDSDWTKNECVMDIYHYEISGEPIWESSRSKELVMDTRTEARKAAIIKANEIRNKQIEQQ